MNSAGLLQLLGSVFSTAVFVTVINGILNRKKLGADTSKVLSDTATGLVDRFEKDNERLRARVESLELSREESILEKEEGRRVLQLHAAWDALVIAALQGANPPITLPPAPPLTPPVIARDHRE